MHLKKTGRDASARVGALCLASPHLLDGGKGCAGFRRLMAGCFLTAMAKAMQIRMSPAAINSSSKVLTIHRRLRRQNRDAEIITMETTAEAMVGLPISPNESDIQQQLLVLLLALCFRTYIYSGTAGLDTWWLIGAAQISCSVVPTVCMNENLCILFTLVMKALVAENHAM